MTAIRRHLHLAPRSSDQRLHSPIDTFFRSLAHDPEVRAVGIVLSGSASDGSQGLAELKNAGAITIDGGELRFEGRALEGSLTDRRLALLAVHESE